MKEKLLQYFKNYYILTSLFLLIWVAFFDKNDLITQYKLRKQLNEMRNERDFYLEKNKQVEAERSEIKSNDKLLEKFAREKYWMKKESEDIYIVEEK